MKMTLGDFVADFDSNAATATGALLTWSIDHTRLGDLVEAPTIAVKLSIAYKLSLPDAHNRTSNLAVSLSHNQVLTALAFTKRLLHRLSCRLQWGCWVDPLGSWCQSLVHGRTNNRKSSRTRYSNCKRHKAILAILLQSSSQDRCSASWPNTLHSSRYNTCCIHR